MNLRKEKIFEIIRYLIVGVLTTGVSLGVYYGLVFTVLNPENAFLLQLANIVSWIVSVLFAFVTNRIFVFKSKNEKKLKEFLSFVGSRLITLFLDMALMFVLVTVLHFNDKIVKLLSQILIIILNYILSKIFVFGNRKSLKVDYQKYLLASFFILPFLLLGEFSSLISDGFLLGILICYFLILSFCLFCQKKYIFLSIVISYFIIQGLYLYCQNFVSLREIISLLSIFLLPVAICSFSGFRGVSDSFLARLFFLLLIIFILPFGLLESNVSEFYLFKNVVTGILVSFLPITVKILKNHANYLAMIFGLLLIVLFILITHSKALALVLILSEFIYLVVERHKAKKILLGFLLVSLITCGFTFSDFDYNHIGTTFLRESKQEVFLENNDKFQNANIEEEVFGISSVEELNVLPTNIDICDIFYRVGYVGMFFYIILLFLSVIGCKLSLDRVISVLLMIFSSIFLGGIWTFSFSSLLVALVFLPRINEKKRILLVSNLYPSLRFKHYGIFVKNTKNALETLGFSVDVVAKKKQTSFFGKVLGYSIMYTKAFYLSLFHSYDYYYVHFVSHTTYPVLLGKFTSTRTKLVCNVHGNDIICDNDNDLKNIERSKRVLKFADKVVCPSKYFSEILVKEYGISLSKIYIYPSGGVDFQVFHDIDRLEAKKHLNLDVNTNYFGFFGRIEKDKGWDTLLEAIHNLSLKKKNIKILVVGTGDEETEFWNLVHRYKLSSMIEHKRFVSQSELVYYYNAIDVLLYPTKRKSESLGLIGLEAMACRTLVIGCVLYGPREYLSSDNALVYKDSDAMVLVSKIRDYFNLVESEKNKLIDNAYQTALLYDKKNLNKFLEDIFK